MNSQISLEEQLRELLVLGNKAGLYDAVDYIKTVIDLNKNGLKKNVCEMKDFEVPYKPKKIDMGWPV